MTRINRALSYFLIFVLLITSINLSQLITVNAASSDIDNFTIKLNWGDPEENLSDTLSINKTNKSVESIKLQVSIEYRGDGTKTYAPGEVSFDITDIGDIICDNGGNRSYSYNIAAELMGSNSGIGDWYYTVQKNTAENELYRPTNTFTFTNKNEISGAFTSSFQIIFSVDLPEQARVTYTKNLSTRLKADGGTKDSNTLTLNWNAKRDNWIIGPSKIEKLSTSTPAILGNLPTGADRDDYIFIQAVYTFEYESYTTIMTQGKLKIELPEDAIAGDAVSSGVSGDVDYLFGGIETTERTGEGVTVTSKEWYKGFESAKVLTVPLAFPRATYQNQTINLDATLSGMFSPETTFIELDTNQLQISFPEFDYVYDGSLYGLTKTPYSQTNRLNYQNMIKAYDDEEYLRGKTWVFKLDTIYTGTPYDIEIGDDLAYAVYSDNTFRKLGDDEICITRIDLPSTSAEVRADVYGRHPGSSEYELYKQNVRLYYYISSDMCLNLENENYCDVKIILKNVTESISSSFTIKTAYRINEARDNGKMPDYIYNFAYLDILMGGTGILNTNTDITNISGLDTAVDNYDIAKTGDKRYRCTDRLGVENYGIKQKLYLGGKTKDVVNASIPIELSNEYRIEDYVGGTEIQYIDYDITIPKHIDYSYDDFTASINFDFDDAKLKSGKLLTGDNCMDYAIFSSQKNLDGTSTIHVRLDFSSDPFVTKKDEYLNTIDVIFNGYTGYDDYVMFELAGETMNFETKATYTTMDGESGHDDDTEQVQYPVNATATYQAVEKKVISDNQGYYDNAAEADLGGEYSYKLKLSAGDTAVKYAVLFDNLETAEISSNYWQGTLVGVDTSALEELGAAPTVYYSPNMGQTHNLSSAGWIESSAWTLSLSAVKSIAVDLGDYVIPANSIAYVEVNMKAPDSAAGCAYNKYSTSYKAYPAGSTNMTPDNAQETVTGLFSNKTTVTLPATEQEINITKKVAADDYLGAHGNGETFIYKITSTADAGDVWYKSIHFEGADFTGMSGSDVAKTAVILLPYGTYTVEELTTTRFTGEITGQSGDVTKKSDLKAEIKVDANAASDTPSVVYKNVKARWDRFNHSDLVINSVGVTGGAS